MRIQWFPGHMHKARQDIGAALSRVDVVIEMLDARIPFSSQNPMLADWRGDKPAVTVLAKSDLADAAALDIWLAHLRAGGGVVARASTTQPSSIRQLLALCRQTYAACGRRRQRLTMMVAGIPNVGKSTLINALAGRAIAKTGDEPAMTRHPQQVELGADLALLDTPGVLWPNLENPNSGMRLAATGAIRATAMPHIEVAIFLADYLLRAYPRALAERFGWAELESPPADAHAALAAIGQQRGCLRRGGGLDVERVAKLFLHEYGHGAFGPMCLETPAMMAQEVAAVAISREAREAAKQVKRQRRARRSGA